MVELELHYLSTSKSTWFVETFQVNQDNYKQVIDGYVSSHAKRVKEFQEKLDSYGHNETISLDWYIQDLPSYYREIQSYIWKNY